MPDDQVKHRNAGKFQMYWQRRVSLCTLIYAAVLNAVLSVLGHRLSDAVATALIYGNFSLIISALGVYGIRAGFSDWLEKMGRKAGDDN